MNRLLILLLLQGAVTLHAQQLTKECYDDAGNLVNEEKSVFCVVGKRVRRLDEVDGRTDTVLSYLDTVKAYYSNIKKLRFIHVYNQYALRDGNYIEFHRDGKVKERGRYKNGKRTGYLHTYYPGGKGQSVLENPKEGESISGWPETDFKIITYWDSAGNQIIARGKGFCNCYFFSGRKEAGKVSDGFRDSLWREYRGDTLILREAYSRGKLVSGLRYHKNKDYRYDKYIVHLTYRGGYEMMMEVLMKHLKYPTEAYQNGVDGTAYVNLVVNENGASTGHSISKGFNKACDEEALRVTKLLNNWEPELRRGMPVRTRFNLPIKFKLN